MSRVIVRAEVVREQLLRRGISQNHLALKAQVSQGYLSQILRRQRSPGPEVRRRLMKALRIEDFDTLFRIESGGDA